MASFTSQVIDFTTSLNWNDAPASARHILKLSLLDWCSVALAGADEPVAQTVRSLVNSEAGTPDATVVGQCSKLPARAAALCNGTTSHALDYDDTHFLHIGHPSVAVFPAALAVAERGSASGTVFLQAALAGFEATCRIGHWFGRSHYEAGFHQTATAGAFGATLAASRILGLTPARTSHAIGLASTRTSGLKSQFGTMGKPYNAGIAASNGVEAALLASLGFISNPDGLDSAQGFADTHTTGQTGDALHGLGTEFVLEAVQHKFHACCHGLHAMLEALRLIQDQKNVRASDIQKIEVRTHPRWLAVCNKPSPETGLEAKFSYRQTAAMTLLGFNTSALESFTAENCRNPDLAALRDRVEVTGDATLRDTETKVTLKTGSLVLSDRFDLSQPRDSATRETRVLAKSATLLGADKSSRLWQVVCELETAKSLAPLAELLYEPR